MPEHETLFWQAHEHQHVEHGRDWYWALGIVALASAGIAIMFGNFLFALLIIVAAVAMGLVAKRPPQLSSFTIDTDGLLVDETRYTPDMISAFWVSELEEEPILIVNTTRFMMPHLVVPLPSDEIYPEDVRDSLRALSIEETELREPVSLRVLEFFGF